MSERNLQDVQIDYNRTCAELGDLHYKLASMTEDYNDMVKSQESKIDTCQRILRKLNKEAQEIAKKQNEAKDEQAAG